MNDEQTSTDLDQSAGFKYVVGSHTVALGCLSPVSSPVYRRKLLWSVDLKMILVFGGEVVRYLPEKIQGILNTGRVFSSFG